MSYYEPQQCRACGCRALVPVFDLGDQNLANEFVKKGDGHNGKFPLKVLLCENCTLAQLSAVVDAEVLYRNHYAYRTSTSVTMKQHFATLLHDIQAEGGKYKSILEIGSNDGELLESWTHAGFKSLMGVEPAKNLAQISIERGVCTRNNFFTSQIAKSIDKQDIVLARHCFCHMDNWHDFIHALEHVTHKNSLVAIEVPYVGEMMDSGSFDQCYHEHLSYLSIQAMIALLHGSAFSLYRINKYPVHGGAILLLLRHIDWHGEQHQSVNDYLAREDVSLERWQAFSEEACRKIDQLGALVRRLVSGGDYVCGYGASAKSSVWCQACHFTKNEIHCILDNTPEKIGMLSPGSDIPIVSEDLELNEVSDYGVCFAWNFLSEILGKQSTACEAGFRFITPVPEVRIVNHEMATATL